MTTWNFATGVLIGELQSAKSSVGRLMNESSHYRKLAIGYREVFSCVVPFYAKSYGRYYALRKGVKEKFALDPNSLIDKEFANKVMNFKLEETLRVTNNDLKKYLNRDDLQESEKAYADQNLFNKIVANADESESESDADFAQKFGKSPLSAPSTS